MDDSIPTCMEGTCRDVGLTDIKTKESVLMHIILIHCVSVFFSQKRNGMQETHSRHGSLEIKRPLS